MRVVSARCGAGANVIFIGSRTGGQHRWPELILSIFASTWLRRLRPAPAAGRQPQPSRSVLPAW
jgi:hypothetical protein